IKMVLHEQAGGCLNLSNLQGGASGLTIPYGGNASLVVSTLDYSPWALQRYMYKISKSPADSTGEWIVMPEGANTITFSDMKMGHCHLLLKKVGSPMQPLSIPLTVKAPNALSWWAICVYALIAAGVIYWVFWYTKRCNLESFREQERQTALENVERKLSFLSDISHDLKTPLSMIIGPVSLMKERAKDQESKKIFETIYDNAVRLNNMIHRTLELQHLEDADESLLILSTFDVVEFCHSVFEVFNENNPQKKFIFHASCPEILIEADAVKLESVITNLLSNACKYSDDSATISCGISKQDDNVEIVVSDDGVGIADTDQTLVFQRMFRSPATSKLREGTGLGLYLIKKYLELMKGNINLYSKEGQGTTFVVTLPISEKVRPQSPRNPESHSPDIPKILIVEDNIQIYGFIMELLGDEYTCFTAENGRSGLAIAASIIPDLIIVDEMMPIMSGLEMVRRMKQHPRLSSVPIIMLTAKTDNKTENESIKLGIDVFMTKPFEPTALTGRISQLLKARREIKEKVRIQAITEAETKPIEAESVNEKNLAKIAKIIEDNISDPDLNVNMLCERSGIPNKQLYRLVRKYMGTAPLDYIRRVRLQKAALLLSQNRFTVSEISYMVGFKTPSYFAKCFQSQYGVKPSQYKSEDESVSYK
ncbi:MAG: response regulator, partial [Muribaculaceae bacterium]|nr:response regulator [Muribaculaceae bacterium]